MKISRASFCEYADVNANGDNVCPNPCMVKQAQGVMYCRRAQAKYEAYLLKEQEQSNKTEKTVNVNKNVRVKKNKSITKKKK